VLIRGLDQKDHDSRYCIVEKKFHIEVIQVKEEREKKQPQVGFSQQKPEEKVRLYGAYHMNVLHRHMIHSGLNCIYSWITRG
jgi:hypothetical protein